MRLSLRLSNYTIRQLLRVLIPRISVIKLEISYRVFQPKIRSKIYLSQLKLQMLRRRLLKPRRRRARSILI